MPNFRSNLVLYSIFYGLVTFILIGSVTRSFADVINNPLRSEGSWGLLKSHISGDAALTVDHQLFNVEAPVRAQDGAYVPVRIIDQPDSVPIQSLSLIIDENPVPLAAEFVFSPAMDPLDLETNIRVNQYSNVRVISQMNGVNMMGGRYVKASGGCSAPGMTDPEAMQTSLGKMQYKLLAEPKEISSKRKHAEITITHPNFSGLQRDQITQLFVPAHYVDSLHVYQGDEKLFSMKAGISLSENPVFRFGYIDNGAENIRVVATDTAGKRFEQIFSK